METVQEVQHAQAHYGFKSHHSGMETLEEGDINDDLTSLNRTIVGWKRKIYDRCGVG